MSQNPEQNFGDNNGVITLEDPLSPTVVWKGPSKIYLRQYESFKVSFALFTPWSSLQKLTFTSLTTGKTYYWTENKNDLAGLFSVQKNGNVNDLSGSVTLVIQDIEYPKLDDPYQLSAQGTVGVTNFPWRMDPEVINQPGTPGPPKPEPRQPAAR